MRDIQREVEMRYRQRGEQAPSGEPNAGLDPRTPGSHPGPKADTQPLSHPGVPGGVWYSRSLVLHGIQPLHLLRDLSVCYLVSSSPCRPAVTPSFQSLPSELEPYCAAVPSSQSSSSCDHSPQRETQREPGSPRPGHRGPLLSQAPGRSASSAAFTLQVQKGNWVEHANHHVEESTSSLQSPRYPEGQFQKSMFASRVCGSAQRYCIFLGRDDLILPA